MIDWHERVAWIGPFLKKRGGACPAAMWLVNEFETLFGLIAIRAGQDEIKDLGQEVQPALVADSREVLVPDAVQIGNPKRRNGMSSSRAMYLQ